MAWVLDPEQDEPVARIEVGAEGAVAMAWSGKGDTVLVWSAHHVSSGWREDLQGKLTTGWCSCVFRFIGSTRPLRLSTFSSPSLLLR